MASESVMLAKTTPTPRAKRLDWRRERCSSCLWVGGFLAMALLFIFGMWVTRLRDGKVEKVIVRIERGGK